MLTKLVPPKPKKRTVKVPFRFLKAHILYLKSIPLIMFFLVACLFVQAQENPSCSVNIQSASNFTCTINSQYLLAPYTLSNDFESPVFSWTLNGTVISPGSNNSAGLDSLLISAPGVYVININDPFNSSATCSSTVTIAEDTTSPGVITQAGTITCAFPAVLLNVSSPTGGVTYQWSGPGQFTSGEQDPSVSIAGVYHVTVTNPANGCQSTAVVKVAIDTTSPNGSASGGVIGCGADSVQIHASSTTQGVIYQWSGPNEFASSSPDPIVTDPGSYTVTIINVSTGCSTDTVVIVTTGDSSTTSCGIESHPIECGQVTHRPDRLFLGYGPQQTKLIVTVSGNGPFTYSWEPAEGLSCTTCADPVFTATQPGLFTFNVTVSSASGCNSNCSITICVLDIRAPYNRCGEQGPQVYLCSPEWTCHGEVDQTVAVDVWQVESYFACHPGCHYGSCGQYCGFKKCDARAENTDANFKTSETDNGAEFAAGNNLLDVLVYPNPFANSFHCRINTTGSVPVNVKLFDMQGHLITEQTDINTDMEQSFANDVASGVYFLQIMQGDAKQVIRIVKTD